MIENPLHKERKAEQQWIHAALLSATSISGQFRSPVSINKISANWRVYPEASVAEAGLSDIEAIADGFIEWWAKRKAEIAPLVQDYRFRHDVHLFLADKIWKAKLEKDFFINPEHRAIVGLCQTYAQMRSSVHEAINRRFKLYGDANLKEEMQRLREDIDRDLSEKLLASMKLTLPYLAPVLDNVTLTASAQNEPRQLPGDAA